MIKNVQLQDTNTLILEAPERIEVSSIYFCNTSGIPQKLFLYIYPAGAEPEDDTLVIHGIEIPLDETLIWEMSEHVNLENGDFVSGYASDSNSITATINYKERS